MSENTNKPQAQYNKVVNDPKASAKAKEQAAEKLNKEDTVQAKDFIHTQTGNLKLEPGEKVIINGEEKYVAPDNTPSPSDWRTV